MHDLLFTNTKALKEANITEYAKKLGLDLTKFNAARNSDKVKAAVKADQAVASVFGARGTPHFLSTVDVSVAHNHLLTLKSSLTKN